MRLGLIIESHVVVVIDSESIEAEGEARAMWKLLPMQMWEHFTSCQS